ncbi:HD domain-containing phosphohydrolase [[Clostridium] aminophilum]|uniref:HD-GYP domain-containing protein n=1 Tax=[Clostridium] aminophilum TaxID=1526 RepID=UPI003333F12B
MALLFVSPSVLTLISYQVAFGTFHQITGWTAEEHLISILSQISITLEILVLSLPIFLYRKVIKSSNYWLALVLCLEFSCADSMSTILSVDLPTKLLAFAVLQLIVYVDYKGCFSYIMASDNSINRKVIAGYMVALKVVLSEMLSASMIFTVRQSQFTFRMLWIDFIALIVAAFFSAFFKMGISSARESDIKLDYMNKFLHAQENIIQTFAEIMEAKSGETGKHVRRVAEYSQLLAKKLGQGTENAAYIRVASMMHDVGKLMIPLEILEKQGALDENEFEVMKTHTTYGDQLLSHSNGTVMNIARDIAYEHHEKWDGSGYPRGLHGDQISLTAQIVAVADVYDALTSKRAYKDAWPPETAKAEILNQTGKHFSPAVVDAFCSCYNNIENARKAYPD